MPNYTYKSKEAEGDCPLCGDGFRTVQPISEEALTSCPSCEGEIRRIVTKSPIFVTHQRWDTKRLLSDDNLRNKGFKKLVKKSDGSYEDVLAKD